MQQRIVADHRRVLRDGLPLIDLRAPAEFALGAFPNAVSLPLLTDSERAAIGTRYKACGQQAAIALGEELVAGETRRARIDAWRAFISANPDAVLYCWRGGLRSEIAQQWLRDVGVNVARIDGGYKALRRACLHVIQEFCATTQLLVLAGRTGSGKTELLREFAANIDLERLVNHRGSAFGSLSTPQPTPIGFENQLAIDMLRKHAERRLLIEDEGRTIGRLALPDVLCAAMQSAPVVVVSATRQERVMRIHREYVEEPLRGGATAPTLHHRFADAVDRIQRRLGGLRHSEVRRVLDAAFAGDPIQPDSHFTWIGMLLDWYYDPMYDHQLTAKQGRIVAVGDASRVRTYLRQELISRPSAPLR